MHIFGILYILLPTVFAVPILASQSNDFTYGGLDDQVPIAGNDGPITKTISLTKTHYEINVVSTVYRTKTESHTTKTIGHDPVQTIGFWVEGADCNAKACSICRMLNDCSDDQEDWYVLFLPIVLRMASRVLADRINSSGCDETYYCKQCGPEDELSVIDVKDVSRRRTCSLGTGRTIDCDELEQAVEHRHEVFKFGL